MPSSDLEKKKKTTTIWECMGAGNGGFLEMENGCHCPAEDTFEANF